MQMVPFPPPHGDQVVQCGRYTDFYGWPKTVPIQNRFTRFDHTRISGQQIQCHRIIQMKAVFQLIESLEPGIRNRFIHDKA